MKLGNGGDDAKGKQTLIMIAAIAVIVIIGGYFVYSNFIAGSKESHSGDAAMSGSPDVPPAPGSMPTVAPPAPGAQPASPTTSAPAAAPTPGAAAPSPRTPAPAPASPAPARAVAPTPAVKGEMSTLKVFGSVNVSYPKGWKIDIKSASKAAVFSDRKAGFEVRPPSANATTGKAIADAALKTVGKTKIIAQSAAKISNFDAYWYAVNSSNGTMRIVGIDSPTRIAVVAYVKSGSFAAYRATFDKMQSGITFGK